VSQGSEHIVQPKTREVGAEATGRKNLVCLVGPIRCESQNVKGNVRKLLAQVGAVQQPPAFSLAPHTGPGQI
jgi:hypothetical protein